MKTVSIRLALISLFLFNGIYAQNLFDGNWSGKLQIMGSELVIKTIFSTDSIMKGTIDIPQQGAKGLKLINIYSQDSLIKFELEAAKNNIAKFSGVLKDSIIKGTFTQSGMNGEFFLTREIISPPPMLNKKIKEEEVKFFNNGITLCGTLTIPDTLGKNPAVIFISGSGAQTRDEEVFDFPVFKVLSNHLASKGIATLRYDDRGMGCSSGSIAGSTVEDFVRDVRAAINFLKTRNEIDTAKIGLLGHSEGGSVASFTASIDKNVNFIILMAAPGDNGSNIIIEQLKKIYKLNGSSDSMITAEVKSAQKIHNVIISDQGWDELKNKIRTDMKERISRSSNSQLAEMENKEIFIENLVENQMQNYKSAWFKSFLTNQPQDHLKKVKCPVLALFGEKDTQVDAKNNSEKIKKALKSAKNSRYSIKIIENANHLFQESKTGLPKEYSLLKKNFISGFEEIISDWILKIVK